MMNIAIICGGNSGEYEISMESAKVVKKYLDKDKYEAYPIVIRFDDWYYQDDKGDKHPIDKADFTLSLNGSTVRFDAVFNAIHGTPGEDGKFQAYLDLLKIPYTSCGVDTSALTFNKFFCNRFVSAFGITVARSISFLKGEHIDQSLIADQLGFPVFVKPAQSGSSVGISKVHNLDDLDAAFEIAFQEDERIIIEENIEGRELACGLLHDGKQLIILPLTEIISKKDFFDYEAKYTKGMADEITPADVSTEVEQDVKAISAMLYHEMNCKGFVRFDFILTESELYFLEVNTIPGISEASIMPQMAVSYGMKLSDFFDKSLEAIWQSH